MKKLLIYSFLIVFSLLLLSCGGNKEDEEIEGDYAGEEKVAYTPQKDSDIQQYNLERRKELAQNRYPCDTLSLAEYVFDTYPDGTYLVDVDQALNKESRYAVIYHNEGGHDYIFGMIARSRPGERLIEPENIVGYDQSFIDLDSTELGTAFFYLVLFECSGGDFSVVWEAPIPSHGGFNNFYLMNWKAKSIPYVRSDFHYARGIGHIDYNYFFVDGLLSPPHLLMTYKGIDFKRTMGNVNNDKYPDYYEFLYYDLGDKVVEKDSIPFIWVEKDSVYVNTRNKAQTRPY